LPAEGKPGLKENDLHAQAIKRAAKMMRKYGRNWMKSTEQKANKQRVAKLIAFGVQDFRVAKRDRTPPPSAFGISEKILSARSAAPHSS